MCAFQKDKIALALSFVSYAGESRQNPTSSIQTALNLFEPYIGTFKIVWGPAWHTDPILDDASAYIVQNASNLSEYYVVVRGTNARSLSSWIWQDLSVDQLIEWSTVPQDPINLISAPSGTPAISKGTNLGMNILLNEMIIPNNQPPIFEFLQSLASASSQQITLNVTGHSLGGALAPTLSLWLNDKWPTGVGAPVKPDIYSYTFAGPSVGNLQFAQCFNDALGTKTFCYKNSLDVVPHAWSLDTLKQIPSIYAPLKMPLLPEIAWGILVGLSLGKNYTAIGRKVDVPSSIQSTIDTWTDQMEYQHSQVYLNVLVNAGIPSNIIDELIKLKSASTQTI